MSTWTLFTDKFRNFPWKDLINHNPLNSLPDKFTNEDLKKLRSISKHRYTVNLLGCFEHAKKLNLVFEFAPPTSLRDHLRAYKSNPEEFQQKLSEKSLITFAIEIAKGLQHLAKKQCFHTDLAAHNILVKENEIKIANYEYPGNFCDSYYLEKTEPGRKRFLWLAPESCTNKMFDEQTNV